MIKIVLLTILMVSNLASARTVVCRGDLPTDNIDLTFKDVGAGILEVTIAVPKAIDNNKFNYTIIAGKGTWWNIPLQMDESDNSFIGTLKATEEELGLFTAFNHYGVTKTECPLSADVPLKYNKSSKRDAVTGAPS